LLRKFKKNVIINNYMKSFIQFIVEGPDTSLPGIRAKREGESGEEYGSYLKGETEKTKQIGADAGNKAKNLGTAISAAKTVKGAIDIGLDVSEVGKPIKIASDLVQAGGHSLMGNKDEAQAARISAAATAIPIPGSGIAAKAISAGLKGAGESYLKGEHGTEIAANAAGWAATQMIPGGEHLRPFVKGAVGSAIHKFASTATEHGVEMAQDMGHEASAEAPRVAANVASRVAPVVATVSNMPRGTRNQPKV
jgi:hypothetical protein